MSLKIGLTGNIGSGKSTICKIFASLGIPIFYADDVSKNLLYSKVIIEQICDVFGKNILDKDKNIDKNKLAQEVFPNPDKLEKLNRILHPAVYKEFEKWTKLHTNHPYTIMEAAILFESGFDKFVDYSINVHSGKNIRLERIIKRDNSNKEMVLNRMKNQWSDEKKIELSDYNINNDGSELIIPQVLTIDKILRSKTA